MLLRRHKPVAHLSILWRVFDVTSALFAEVHEEGVGAVSPDVAVLKHGAG